MPYQNLTVWTIKVVEGEGASEVAMEKLRERSREKEKTSVLEPGGLSITQHACTIA